MNDLVFMTAEELARNIRQRHVSATEVLDTHLQQIASHNPALNAIVTLDEERARTRAQQADAALARGDLWGPLHGVPVTIKDSIETAGLRTTSGFPPLTDYVPATDAPVVARLRAAGAIILVVGAWRLRRKRVTPGPAAAAMMHEILNEDKRAAVEVILEERTGHRDPEDRDGNLPDVEAPERLH